MNRASRIAKGAAKKGASTAARGAAGFVKKNVKAGYEAGSMEKCPHCGAKSKASARVCPNCGRDK
jgi:uncharacterized OB-fold protein